MSTSEPVGAAPETGVSATGSGASPTASLDALRAENARLKSEVDRLRATAPARSAEPLEFAAILNTMPHGVVYQDASGKVVWMNSAAERILGKTRAEFLGETSVSTEHHTIREDGTPFPGLEHPAMVALGTGMDIQGVTMGVFNPREMAYRWITVSAVPVSRSGGSTPDHVYTLFDDITDRKRAEEALRASEERLRLAVSAGPMATWDWHVPSGEVSWNDEHFRILGYEPGSIVPSYQAWAERVHPEDRTATEELIRSSVERCEDYRAEFRAVTPDGAVRWIEARARMEGDAAGRPLRQYGVMLDITDRRRAEEALRASEERLRLVIENSRDGINLLDLATGRYVVMSPSQVALTGFTAEEMDGLSVEEAYERVHPEDREMSVAQQRAVAAGRDVEPVEYRWRVKNGEYRWFSDSRTVIRDQGGRAIALVGVSRDVTERKRAEEAIRESERQLRELSQRLTYHVDNSPLAVIEWGPDMRLIRWSSTAERVFGWRADEVLGKRIEEFRWVYPEDEPKVDEVSSDLMKGINTRRFSANRNYRKDGSVVDCEWYNSSLLDESGNLRSILSLVLDVTERNRAEAALRQSERLYRGIGESIDYGIWVCAPDGRNTYASESFLKLVGLTQEQCSDFGWGDVLHSDDAERTIAAWQECVRTGGSWDIEHRVRGVDGRWHTILARGVPVRNERGEVDCWAGINLDVSRLKQAEADLRESEAALREADTQKNRFLAVLSHELRNPLTPITNSLFILDRAAPGGEQASRAKAVIGRQVSQLTRLVDDLLDVTRIVSGKLALQRTRFDLALLLRRTADDHRAGFADAGVTIDVRVGSEPVWMVGDESRMAQATGNLLGNATKFTGSGGRVVLGLEIDRATVTGVISVRDTGVGIHPDLMRRIFEPFVQGDSSLDRSKGGLGLGLALVKSVIELHGGTVEARSGGVGQGAEFVIRVPAEAQPVPGPAPLRPASDCSPSRRVLVIEDNVDAADSFREILELGAHRVEVAYSGPEGLQKARRFGPDVVFCDIGLPGMDGYEVARRSRSDDALRSAYLVALSGYAQPEDQQRATEAGFDAHMAKPPAMERIADVLGALPSGSAATRS
jgi:PAS domain S-box-containing protein